MDGINSRHNVNDILFNVIVDAAILFELSDEEDIDPDLSVNALEQMAAELKKLPEETKHEFLEFVAELASNENDKSKAQFLVELPDSFGLMDD